MVDATDLKLLRVLQHEPTLSVAELGERIGLTHTPCWRRLKRLLSMLLQVVILAMLVSRLIVVFGLATGAGATEKKTKLSAKEILEKVDDLYREDGIDALNEVSARLDYRF